MATSRTRSPLTPDQVVRDMLLEGMPTWFVRRFLSVGTRTDLPAITVEPGRGWEQGMDGMRWSIERLDDAHGRAEAA